HGLPLTLPERERAAGRILRLHRQWADRRIAEVCGLSPTTVARIRSSAALASSGTSRRPTNQSGQLDKRIGRDRRLRPVDSSPLRHRIADALRANPAASLRVVAAKVGASPETVRRVRDRLPELLRSPDGQPPPSATGVDKSAARSADGADVGG